VEDRFGYLEDPALQIDRLPAFRFELVQDGADLVPLRRGPQASDHPHWEFILEPGRVWDEAGDGGWSRAALPFALQERNANCTHNGLLTFLFRSDGAVSRVAWQIGSETCRYLKIDFWGMAAATDGRRPARPRRSRRIGTNGPPTARAAAVRAGRRLPGHRARRVHLVPAGRISAVGFAIDGCITVAAAARTAPTRSATCSTSHPTRWPSRFSPVSPG
jgi:hypothetical protein